MELEPSVSRVSVEPITSLFLDFWEQTLGPTTFSLFGILHFIKAYQSFLYNSVLVIPPFLLSLTMFQ